MVETIIHILKIILTIAFLLMSHYQEYVKRDMQQANNCMLYFIAFLVV